MQASPRGPARCCCGCGRAHSIFCRVAGRQRASPRCTRASSVRRQVSAATVLRGSCSAGRWRCCVQAHRPDAHNLRGLGGPRCQWWGGQRLRGSRGGPGSRRGAVRVAAMCVSCVCVCVGWRSLFVVSPHNAAVTCGHTGVGGGALKVQAARTPAVAFQPHTDLFRRELRMCCEMTHGLTSQTLPLPARRAIGRRHGAREADIQAGELAPAVLAPLSIAGPAPRNRE